jgi:hypothetical protein
MLKPDETYSFTFKSAGRFRYHDSSGPTQKGTITVNAPAASVTLSAASSTVVYGNTTTLSGSVTNQLTSEPVTLTAQPYGKGIQSIDTTTTQSNGSFSFEVSPTIRTAYTAHWHTTGSPAVTVNVAPRVGFGRMGRLYVAKVTSDIGYGGHYVLLQRRAIYGWSSMKRIYLGANSRAVFRTRLPRGRSVLRLVLPQNQAGVGYVQISRLLAVVR